MSDEISTYRGSVGRRDELVGLADGRVDVVDVDVPEALVGLAGGLVAEVAAGRAGAGGGEVAVLVDGVGRVVGDECVGPEEVVHPLAVRPVIDHRVPNLQKIQPNPHANKTHCCTN